MTPNKKPQTSRKSSKKTLWLAIGIIAIILVGIGAYIMLGQSSNPPTTTPTPTPTPTPNTSPTPAETDPNYAGATKVLLHTSAGDITLALRVDKPITTANFINIVNKGWYDSTVFHRVIAGFMIQGGAISQSTPTIADEIGNNNHNLPYTIAMAKTSDPNSATSQFFINVGDNSKTVYPDGSSFDGTYTVFGKVTSGQNIVDSIANAQVTQNPYTHENSSPVQPVTLIKASIVT